jgi:putative ABC transport system ATP-binding protein
MIQAAIHCRGIKKSYGHRENQIQALKGVDLDVREGELTLLVGPSGSGKTTLLSIITSILTPDEGDIFLLGNNIHEMSEGKRAKFCRDHLGIVFQSLFLIPTLTNAENVALPLFVEGFKEKIAIERAKEYLKKMALENRAHSSPAHLSKGQQQRVAIARAMINNAKILICDEPTSALDQAAGINVMNLLRDFAKNESKAVLVVTHDHRIFSFADRIVRMSDGQIIEEQTNE